jgi:hypothetical protein
MIMVIKYGSLTLLHHFNTAVAKNFPGYEHTILGRKFNEKKGNFGF